MPDSFEEQGELIWQHIGAILKSAGMNYQHVPFADFYSSTKNLIITLIQAGHIRTVSRDDLLLLSTF